MAAFATPGDVAARLGTTFTAEETIQAEVLLDDASEIIRTRRPLIDTWIADGSVRSGMAKKVVCDSVMAYLNGAGIGVSRRAHPELADEYTDAASKGVTITEEQLNLLTPDVKESRPFSIRPMGDS